MIHVIFGIFSIRYISRSLVIGKLQQQKIEFIKKYVQWDTQQLGMLIIKIYKYV